MKKRVIQIKGANATGKTTIVKELMKQSKHITLYEWEDTHKVFATGIDDIDWIAIGKYDADKRMGGCDTMKSIDDMKEAILYCITYMNYSRIVFEGAMISTIVHTFYDWLLQMENVDPIFVLLTSTYENCIERMMNRGTKPSLKGDKLMRDKISRIYRQIRLYDPKYVRVIDVDKTPLEMMVHKFLHETSLVKV